MTLTIPTVTQEDLAAFHWHHFPPQDPSPATVASDPSSNNSAPPAGDDLGYYPDGVKRTLTDEQIMMFRHSEVHRLMKEKLLEKTKRKNAQEELDARKKVQLEFEKTISEAAGSDLNAQHTQGRLQAALWASQQEWADQLPPGAHKFEPEVKEVEFQGRSFLWPRISSPSRE